MQYNAELKPKDTLLISMREVKLFDTVGFQQVLGWIASIYHSCFIV